MPLRTCCNLHWNVVPSNTTPSDDQHARTFQPHTPNSALNPFSLRKDWRVKLHQDCARIREVGHRCDQIVFGFVKQPTPSERDKALESVKTEFGWNLLLYGIERLRTQLSGCCNHLISSYPSIFSPRFFENVGGILVGKQQRDLVLIDHVDADFAFASRLARKLEIAGYKVCCNGLAPFGGTNLDQSVRKLIDNRACRYLAILSPEGAADDNLRGRCEAASSVPDCLLPVKFQSSQIPGVSSRRYASKVAACTVPAAGGSAIWGGTA